jgi:crossover junction endodeoxyribonuclease RuvC
MKILGIDPGSRLTGWGVVAHDRHASTHVASGTIRLPERQPLAERLVLLSDALQQVLRDHAPDACALEQIFTARNARSALVLGHARGVILCEVMRAAVPVYEYTPTQIKQAVVGYGRADKAQMQQMVALLLNRKPAPQEDEADALAAALTHAAMSKWMEHA